MRRALNKLSRRKFSLFFILGILVLSFGFILSNCGKGEQTKILIHDKGQFALHLPLDSCHGDGVCSVSSAFICGEDSDCPAGETCIRTVSGPVGNSSVVLNAERLKESVKSSDLTIEAWVKTAPSTANNSGKGVIFSFGSKDGGGGLALYLWQKTAGLSDTPPKQCPPNAPNGRCVKFFIYDVGSDDTETITDSHGNEKIIPIRNSGDEQEALAFANNDIVDGQWHHVAAVLDGTTMTIYIDGVPGNNAGGDYPNQNSNGIQLVNFREEELNKAGEFASPLAANIGSNFSNFQLNSLSVGGFELGAGPGQAEPDGTAATYIFSNGDFTLDEVRLWGTAKTQAQIQDCMNLELDTFGSGDCTINDDLKGYWKFNKGKTSVDGSTEDASSNDFSGNGISGSNTQCEYPGDSLPANLITKRCDSASCGGCGQGFKDKNGDGKIDADTDGDGFDDYFETELNDIPFCSGGWVDGVPGLVRAGN